MKKVLSISLLLLLTFAPAKAYYYFNRYLTSNGLPSNSVFCTVQDKDGFIWVGTRDGISRFDGYSFMRMGDTPERKVMNGPADALFVDGEGLVWFSTGFGTGSYNPYTGEVTTLDSGSRSPISQIVQDANSDIWFCSTDLYKYNKATGSITKYPSSGVNFINIASDAEGQIWSIRSDGRLLRYDSLLDKFKEEPYGNLQKVISISGGRLLATTADADVLVIDPVSGRSERIFNSEIDSSGRWILCLLERVPGEFWISTTSGIYVYQEGTGITGHITAIASERMSISSNNVTNLFLDQEGNVWASTPYDGLNIWCNNRSAYYVFYPVETSKSITGTVVNAVTGSDGRVWVCTEDAGLNVLYRNDSFFHYIPLPGVNNVFQDILPVGNDIWVTTKGNGIYRMDIPSQAVTRHYKFASNNFCRLLHTAGGDILVASTEGVYRYLPDSDSFDKVPGPGDASVSALFEDSSGTIWVGTAAQGIILLDREFNTVGQLEPESRITSFFEDSRHRIWVTTEGEGIWVSDLESIQFRRLTRADGLPSDVTCSVLEDEDGMMWIATIRGLCVVDSSDLHVSTSPLQRIQIGANQYTYGAAYKSETGPVFMGTTEGLVSFTPSIIKSLHSYRSVFITSISGVVGEKYTELASPGRSAAYSDRIVASYKDVSSLYINFSCPNYSNILSSRFRYSLSSRRGEINEVTSKSYAVLSNLGYGKHIFTVSLEGSDAPESTKSVEIIVRPPFIKSAFAKVLLASAFLLALSVICYFILRSKKEKRLRKLDELEKAKQKEMYESKNAFFTNITHEIRTPLSLIKMPLDRIIKSGKYSEKDLLAIQANTDRLLNLTNQLLDIRKLELNEEKLEFTKHNICDIVRRTTARFSTMAEDQGVSLTVSVPDSVVYAMCARDSVEKIVSNLISNAFKYGEGVIDVSLKIIDGKAVIRVDSNGERISAANSEKIFNKFVHGGKGTGLGLPLARTLAELHDGCLYLDTSRTDVNSFVAELPLDHPESIAMSAADEPAHSEEEQSYDDSRRDILIVEDNPDFRLYLAETLSDEFNVFTAANGKAALDKLAARKIDLIVSDIMMPVMDGCELCNTVKSTFEYSHIPIILLTAAVGMETRMETLEVGADGYIEKPFPIELLRANIANLFKNRDIAFHQFANSPLTHLRSTSTNKMDEELMSRLHAYVLNNMSEHSLSIDNLASALNISSSTLYRKVKANSGMNINEYIRLCRLKRAAELLASRQYRVNEVADMVGFSSSSYFAANFQKQFNISPSSFLKSL